MSKFTQPTLVYLLSDANRSGAPIQTLHLCKRLVAEFDLKIIIPSGPIVEEFQKLGLTPMITDFNFGSIFKIRSFLKNLPPKTIIHCQGVKAGRIGSLASLGLHKTVVYTEHNWTADYHLASKVRERLQLFSLRLLSRFAKKIVCVSESVRNFYREHQLAPASKLTVIYNGVEFLDLQKHSQTATIVFGTASSLNKRKGIDLILRAIAKLPHTKPQVRLVVAGGGMERENLQELATELEITDRVEFLGEVNKMPLFWKKIDVYIQASYDESFGMALVEALGNGLPSIASKVGAVPEIAKNQDLLFNKGDVEDLTTKVLMLISKFHFYKNLAEQDKTYYRQKFSTELMVKSYKNQYLKLLK
jgi:glycosyltransferase involved in cell wall biosynthesis